MISVVASSLVSIAFMQQADLDKFSSNNRLPTITVTDVPLPGGANSPGQEADAEVLLDIEVAAAVYY